MIVTIGSFLFLNLILLLLITIGSTAMASVEGVALPWMDTLLSLWVVGNIPYAFYALLLMKNRKDTKRLNTIKHTIASSAWLAFPGGIVMFIFFGSKIYWVGYTIPAIQILLALYVYVKYR